MRLLKLQVIVVATDVDATSHPALASAHRLAQASGAALHVLHVSSAAGTGDSGAAAERARHLVHEALETAGVPMSAARVHVVAGPVADAISDFAEDVSADVIVLGPHRERDRVTGGHALGGTARQVVERANAPCLVAARALRLPLERVLVPTDLSDTARGALLVGLSWASALRLGGKDPRTTSLTALRVVASDDAPGGDDDGALLDAELAAMRESMGSWAGIEIGRDTEQGSEVAQAIGRHAREHDADLVVIGTRGRSGAAARLGSVSAAVTLHVQVPTLLVPPSVWREYTSAP